jgi:hypothetical protein
MLFPVLVTWMGAPVGSWLEYSFSASIMAVAIAISLGMREQNILVGIFMLHWCTMVFGFLTEFMSGPFNYKDTTQHTRPVTDFDKKNSGKKDNFEVNYNEDPDALMKINVSRWADDDYDCVSGSVVIRRCAPLRRLLPHLLGWFPCIAAWTMMLCHLEQAKLDLYETDPTTAIPSWVNIAIYGTVLIFWR